MEPLNLKYSKAIEKRIKTLIEKDNLSKTNTELIIRFVKKSIIQGIGERRAIKYFGILKNIANWLGKDFDKATKEDIERIVGYIATSNYQEWTKWSYRVIIKLFWKWLEGNDEYYPEKVKWIKAKQMSAKIKPPEDLITREELEKIIALCSNNRDKCIIALLYESGIRIGELLNLKVKNVELNSNPVKLFVDSQKTKTRRKIPIVESVPYIVKWLEEHPDPKPNSPLFVKIHRKRNKNCRMHYENIYKLMRKINEKLDNGKKIYPHLFRHSRASELANYLTEAQMCKYFGWAMGSDMPAVYVHLSGRDIDNAIMNIYGIEKKPDIVQKKLTPKLCPRCKKENLPTARYCENCGLTLNIGERIDENSKENISMFVLNKLWDSKPELREMIQEVTKKFEQEIRALKENRL